MWAWVVGGRGLYFGPPEDEVGFVVADRDFLSAGGEFERHVDLKLELDVPFSRALSDTSRHDALVESFCNVGHASHVA